MARALFSGTFDPPSLGHVDIIQKASKMCTHVIVAIGVNLFKKNGLLSADEKMALLKELTKDLKNVEVAHFKGPVADFAKEKKMDFIIRGLRPFADISFEMQMAMMNRKLTGIETFFLLPDEKYGYISSSLIRELAFYRADLGEFVPKKVEETIYQRFAGKTGKSRREK